MPFHLADLIWVFKCNAPTIDTGCRELFSKDASVILSAMMILIVAIYLSSGIDILRQRARRYPNELFEVIAIEEKRARRRGDARRASPTVRPENAVKMNQIG